MTLTTLLIWSTLTATVLAPTAANANFASLDPGGPTGCSSGVYRADNGTHSYRFEALSADGQGATNWAMSNAIDPTVMDAVMDPTPDSSTDAWVTDTYYTTLCGHDWHRGASDPNGGVVGLYTCESTTGSGACQQAKVRYNNNFTDLTSTSNRRGLACHENGHSIGLEHLAHTNDGTQGCMPQGYPKPANVYSPHDRIHLASAY